MVPSFFPNPPLLDSAVARPPAPQIGVSSKPTRLQRHPLEWEPDLLCFFFFFFLAREFPVSCPVMQGGFFFFFLALAGVLSIAAFRVQ